MSGPLSGYRIVDLTRMIAGPMATMILGDQGADVIKIESPGIGDLTRAFAGPRHQMAPMFAVANRNKRSVVLNLNDRRAAAVMERLVATADVLVHNFRPGVASKLGVGEDAMRRVRPDLIYVSISGFGETGPYAHKRSYDPVIQALSGLAWIQGVTGRPKMIRLIIADKVTALTAAQAITAALLERTRSGKGQHVKLAMLDAVISFLWAEGMAHYTFFGDRYDSHPAPTRIRDLVFETADGFITAGANSDQEWQALATALEHPEWATDSRFATPAGRERTSEDRLELMAGVLKTRSSADWLKRLEAHKFHAPRSSTAGRCWSIRRSRKIRSLSKANIRMPARCANRGPPPVSTAPQPRRPLPRRCWASIPGKCLVKSAWENRTSTNFTPPEQSPDGIHQIERVTRRVSLNPGRNQSRSSRL